MIRKFRLFLFLILIAATGTGGGGNGHAGELFLANKAHLVNKNDAALVESMAETLRKSANGTLDDFTVGRIHFTRADLNGDGIEEFIAMASTSYVCGNSPYCQTSIYSRSANGLRYIGTIFTTGKIGVMDNFVNVEDNWSNGWRVLNSGEYRYCWLRRTDPDLAYSMKDILGMPHEPGQAGYFASVEIGEKCPKEIPKSD